MENVWERVPHPKVLEHLSHSFPPHCTPAYIMPRGNLGESEI